MADGSSFHFQRVDVARNMARYYSLSLQPTLFGDVSLVRNWGRIGTRGQQKIELFSDHDHAFDCLQDLIRRKHRKGYR